MWARWLVGAFFVLFGVFVVIRREVDIGEPQPIATLHGVGAILVGLAAIALGAIILLSPGLSD